MQPKISKVQDTAKKKKKSSSHVGQMELVVKEKVGVWGYVKICLPTQHQVRVAGIK